MHKRRSKFIMKALKTLLTIILAICTIGSFVFGLYIYTQSSDRVFGNLNKIPSYSISIESTADNIIAKFPEELRQTKSSVVYDFHIKHESGDIINNPTLIITSQHSDILKLEYVTESGKVVKITPDTSKKVVHKFEHLLPQQVINGHIETSGATSLDINFQAPGARDIKDPLSDPYVDDFVKPITTAFVTSVQVLIISFSVICVYYVFLIINFLRKKFFPKKVKKQEEELSKNNSDNDLSIAVFLALFAYAVAFILDKVFFNAFMIIMFLGVFIFVFLFSAYEDKKISSFIDKYIDVKIEEIKNNVNRRYEKLFTKSQEEPPN